MSTFIRCPECGFCIGKYVDFIDKAKHAIYEEKVFNSKEYKAFDPEKMVFNSNITPSLQGLFDAVGIDNRCCRMHIVSKTNFNKLYR